MIKICPKCNKTFKTPKRSKKYCSRYCMYNRTKEIHNCFQCKKEIIVGGWLCKAAKRHFCSRECRIKWKKEFFVGSGNPMWGGGKFIEKQCSVCGKDFRFWPSQQRYSVRFCSAKCRESKLFESISDKAKNWEEIRKILPEKYNHRCQICGKHATLVHHKNYDSINIEDFLVLCQSCHRKIHYLKNNPILLND